MTERNISKTWLLSYVAWTEPTLYHRPDDFQLSHHKVHHSKPWSCGEMDISSYNREVSEGLSF